METIKRYAKWSLRALATPNERPASDIVIVDLSSITYVKLSLLEESGNVTCEFETCL